MNLVLENVVVEQGAFRLEASLEAGPGATVLFGPSGSGKTSLLETIAGLRHPAGGIIRFGGEILVHAPDRPPVPARHRRFGYVPQDLCLFPHLSVRDNLLFATRAPGRPPGGPDLDGVCRLLEIGPLLSRNAGRLSGGERQRVALARALMSAPRLLLLDEPLASLDLQLRARILPYLARVRDETGIPMLYVTHDRTEALTLGSHIVVLDAGRVLQCGRVQDVFHRPGSPAVAGIVAVESILPGEVDQLENGVAWVRSGAAVLRAAYDPATPPSGRVHVCIRAEDVILSRDPAPSHTSARNRIPSLVKRIEPHGLLMRAELSGDVPLVCIVTRDACEELCLKPGQPVTAWVKAQHVHLIPRV